MTCPNNQKGEHYPRLPVGAHDYEYIPYCATRVCNLCQDHAGKDSCNNCIWRRPAGEETSPFYEHGKSAEPKDDDDDLFSVPGDKPICMASGDTPVQRDLKPNEFISTAGNGGPVLEIITEPLEFDVQLGRGGLSSQNIAITNVPWTVIHHSPTGFEWNYGGSGPADLALNILNAFRPPRTDGDGDGHEPVKCFHGRCSKTAWDLHQAFKWKFIARMPKHGGSIPKHQILDWLERVCDPIAHGETVIVEKEPPK